MQSSADVESPSALELKKRILANLMQVHDPALLALVERTLRAARQGGPLDASVLAERSRRAN